MAGKCFLGYKGVHQPGDEESQQEYGDISLGMNNNEFNNSIF